MKLIPKSVKGIKNVPQKTETSFPIVAIGASAGGLEAISELLKNLPSNTGMAFIYVQHLSPDHKSILSSILSKRTKMKVQEIVNMSKMLPNNIYVIPPNKGIQVTDGHIKLLPHLKGGAAITIDVLFSSLAATHKANVIGVILSGYASDGKIGLKAIKDAGGVTFAQDDSAQASSMPKSAIATGAVDFILSPKRIALELVKISIHGLHQNKIGGRQHKLIPIDLNADLNAVFEILFKKTGVDFSHYKMPTIKRRLNLKMAQAGAKNIKAYIKILTENSAQVDLLYKDLLINVTDFFRDKDVFHYLKTTFLPKILKSKTPDESLRIWVPACSSGEEVYSIAMLISDMQDKKGRKIPVQIFGTDLSEEVIRDARIGAYSQSDIKTIPKKYLDRFFIKTGSNYQIVKELREMCVFAPHNILRDPPFSRMDFISCRNLLIYFDPAAQKKVFSALHFSLNEKGYLMLGKAESVGTSSTLFTTVNNKFKLYSGKKNAGIKKIIELPLFYPKTKAHNKTAAVSSKSISAHPKEIENAIDSVLLASYMPACAVVNKDMEILQFRGPISLYLKHPSGKASLNILKMTQPEFAFELRNAIHKAIKTKQLVTRSGIEVTINSVLQMISMEVSPLKIEWEEPLLLVVFKLQEQLEKVVEHGKSTKTSSGNITVQKDRRIKKLTEELNNTRIEMNSIIESHEKMYEELQAANEEIVSSNEEFQTLNEELETSKEETEATNEELISYNQEIHSRNSQLLESQEFSDAIINTIHEPMLVLYKDFSIKLANKTFYEKFVVKKEETEGKYLFELGNKQWNIPKLRKMLNDVVSKNRNFERFEVTHRFPGIGDKTMLLNARLIVQNVKSEKLILLAIADVSEERRLANILKLKEAKILQNEEKEKWAAELFIANKELVFQNREKEKREAELVIANKELVFQTTEKEKRAAELVIADIELKFQNKEKEKREIANKELEAFSNSAKLASQYARSLIEASLDPLVTISVKGKITDVNEASVKATGISREKLINTDFSNYFTEPKKAELGYLQVFEKGFVADYPLTIKHKNGKLTDVLYNASVYKDDKGNVLGVFAAARDVTEQKRIEETLEKSLKEISDYKFALDEFSIVAITDQKGIIKHANDNFCKISKYSREELIGKDHRIIKSGFHSKAFFRDLWNTISDGQIWRGELKNRAKDGSIYWVTTTIVPFLDEQGKPYQYVAVRTDITDQKRNAQELTEAKEFAEDAKEKAEKDRRIAEEAVQSKQQFLSNMSHEIRTPMNAIIGFTKVLLKTDLSAKQKEYLSAIRISGEALTVLINDILDLAKVDSGKMIFEKTAFKMKVSISAMLHLFETTIREKNLEFEKIYDKKIPEVLVGDPVRLHQIILNLVSNAVKFTSNGKISVSVNLLNEDEKTATLEFKVKDTGIGIPADKIGSIFEVFQQASSETSRLYGGTGLGLAIVKQLIEPQGGSIRVESKENEGSTFSFILPFQKTNAKANLEIGLVELDPEIKNIKVLVVEDIALNQLLMKTLLDDFGFERDFADNGKIAIEKLQTKSYDIILMDLQMPEMNGFEATEYIRNTLKSKIPIIALTADVTTVDLAKCKAIGMNDYIAKPVDERLLYSKIVGIVKKPLLKNEVVNEKNINEVIQTYKYVDLKYLIQRTKSNSTLIKEMISVYLEQTPPLIIAMKKSMLDKDWHLLNKILHKMTPSFTIMGIHPEHENIAKKIQEYIETKSYLEKIPNLVLKLEGICSCVCEELRNELIRIKNEN